MKGKAGDGSGVGMRRERRPNGDCGGREKGDEREGRWRGRPGRVKGIGRGKGCERGNPKVMENNE